MSEALSLLNRASEPFDASKSCWAHVCPFGEHPWTSADGSERIIQVIDREAVEAMAISYPIGQPDSRFDVDHKSMDVKNTTEASGWGKETQIREDGLWVRADLTDYGLPLVKGKIYQFTSPCFPRDGLVDLGNGRMRVTKLGVIALTNDPNLRGQKPLTNSRTHAANPKPNTPKPMDYKAMLLKLLGLPADASDEQINTACNSKCTNDAAMNTRITELLDQLTNRDFEDHGITDAAQRKLLSPMLANKETREAALSLMSKGKRTESRPPVHNRSGAPVPATNLSKPPDDAEAEERAFNAEVMDYKNSKGCTYQQAHNYVTNRRRMASK